MSTLSQFSGGAATRSIVNAYSSGGVSAVSMAANTSSNQAREVLSGALTASTLKDVLSITSPGQMPFLTAYSKNATSRTIRLVVILDGVTVFDATSNAIAASGTGLMAAGAGVGGSTNTHGAPIRWNASCLIRVASSLSETDAVGVAYSLT